MRAADNIPEDFENLEKYAPNLVKTPKGNGYSIPEGYFEGLSKEIQLEVIASSFEKQQPFDIPPTYFENLPSILQNKISIQAKKVKIINFKRFSKTQLLAAAASIAILCLIGVDYWKTSQDKPAEKTMEYLADHIDQSILEDALAEEPATKAAPQGTTETSADYINYLIDNHIEVNTLINALKESD